MQLSTDKHRCKKTKVSCQKICPKTTSRVYWECLQFSLKNMSVIAPKNDLEHCYIVIMAGGSGTRLWPLSRKAKPKQFQTFTSEKTMLQETFFRVSQVVPAENIFISTTKQYSTLVLAQLQEMAQERLILEPEARNTAPAIALVATLMYHHDPEAIVATIASDHAIENDDEFVATLRSAFITTQTNRDKLVTVGINPTRPDTGLGYIKMGKELSLIAGKRVFEIDDFKEKPDRKTAEQYISEWEYLWNAGYFIFSAATFAEWTKVLAPTLNTIMAEILKNKQNGTLNDTTLATLYGQTASEPIDTLIAEKLSNKKRLVIPSSLKWSDVGNWQTLYEFLHEKSGNQSIISGHHIDVGSKHVLVHGSDRLIATIGVEDLIIVDTPDALLVARRDCVSGDIKTLIEKLKEGGHINLL
jgi:mannose-1-phosphate guanylyltransferase